MTKVVEEDAWKAGEVARGQRLEKLLFIKGIKLPEEQVKVMENDEQLWRDIKKAEEEDYWGMHPMGSSVKSLLFNYALSDLKEHAKDEQTYQEQKHKLMWDQVAFDVKRPQGQVETIIGSEGSGPAGAEARVKGETD